MRGVAIIDAAREIEMGSGAISTRFYFPTPTIIMNSGSKFHDKPRLQNGLENLVGILGPSPIGSNVFIGYDTSTFNDVKNQNSLLRI